jgi:hypothetical protein
VRFERGEVLVLQRASFSPDEAPMQKMTTRIALGMFLILAGFRPAEASRITVREGSDTGGGSIINSGSGDIYSSNGSSSGDTSLMSELGFTDLTLSSDLSLLTVSGSITDPFTQGLAPATSADLSILRVYGTVATPCTGCATLDDVKVGGSLHLDQDANGNLIDPANVLFAFDIVGPALDTLFPSATWAGPTATNLQSTQTVGLGTPLLYYLTQAQINFIVDRMTLGGYSVGDVRLGLGVQATGRTATGGFEPVQSDFGIDSIPEPASLFLFASGLLGVAARRWRTVSRH